MPKSLVATVTKIIDTVKGGNAGPGGKTLTGEPIEPVVINPDVRLQLESAREHLKFSRRPGGITKWPAAPAVSVARKVLDSDK